MSEKVIVSYEEFSKIDLHIEKKSKRSPFRNLETSLNSPLMWTKANVQLRLEAK